MRKITDPNIAAKFDSYPKDVKKSLLRLRQMIFDVASETNEVGEIKETLKWGQPSYITFAPKSGTTIRIDRVKNGTADYALYVHCQTSLIDSFRMNFGDTFSYEGNRAILFFINQDVPTEALRECIKMALTYHLKK